jgi:hypothetical protein
VVSIMSRDIGAVHSAAVPYPIDSRAEFMNAPAYVDFIFGRPRCTLFTGGTAFVLCRKVAWSAGANTF